MREFYTVGEIAKLFNVSTDTLRYYDKLNLIKPWKKGVNGYRYYSKAQFEMISTILFLRSAGTPIEKLYGILKQNSTERITEELVRHKKALHEKIRHLEYLEQRVSSLHRSIGDVSDVGRMTIETRPDFWVITKEFDEDADELDLEEIVRINRSTDSEWISFANIFSTIDKEHLLQGDYHTYKRYGFISEYPCETTSDHLSVWGSRLYACANAKSLRIDLEDIDRVYDDLKTYLSSEGYAIAGEAIERNVFDLYRGENREFIHFFKIYIPVEPCSNR